MPRHDEKATPKAISWPIRGLALVLGFGLAVMLVLYFVRHTPSPSDGQPMQVTKLIEAVREQLAAAEKSRIEKGQLPLFLLKDFEMEINYVVRNSGGVQAEVVGVGTNLDAVNEQVQKLHLRWEAIPPKEDSVPPTICVGDHCPEETRKAK